MQYKIGTYIILLSKLPVYVQIKVLEISNSYVYVYVCKCLTTGDWVAGYVSLVVSFILNQHVSMYVFLSLV